MNINKSEPSSLRNWLIRIILLLLAMLLLTVIGVAAWAAFPPPPMPEALAALASDDKVSVSNHQWIEFIPSTKPATIGLIFYPGGRVDPRAYAPALHELAAAGYYAVIVPMRLNLAVLSPNRADAVIAAHPEITDWVISGHSLGGSMAASYVFSHPDKVQGLVLWASYPQESTSLADQGDLRVTSIYGSSDGLVNAEEIQKSKTYLPQSTNFVAITGGNHAQFGWYGDQSGDNPATIHREEQQAQTVAATEQVLQEVGQ